MDKDERHGRSKLSNMQARMIRAEYAAGQDDPRKRVTYDDLSAKHDMSGGGAFLQKG